MERKNKGIYMNKCINNINGIRLYGIHVMLYKNETLMHNALHNSNEYDGWILLLLYS